MNQRLTPETAFRRVQWRMLLATMFCYLFYYTGRHTFGFAIPGIEAELGVGKTTLGAISGLLLWCYAVGQAINGNLGDVFGGRRMMSLGAILSCGLNWIVSFATSVLTLALPWGANGLAQSMGWAPGSRVLSNWWGHRERGKAYGFYVFAAGLSSVLSFTTSLIIIDTLALDWRWIFRLPVLLLLVGGVVYYLVVRDRPEDLGWPPLEDEVQDASTIAPPDESTRARYLHALTNPRFLVASVSIGFQSIARYGLIIWVPVHFLGESWKNDPSGRWISLALAVGMAIGALTSGWLSDRVFNSRRSPLITLFMLLAAGSTLAMFVLPPSYKIAGIILLFLCGFFAYGPQSAFWALCPDLLGTARAGTGTGVMNTFAYLFAGLGEIGIGYVIETSQNDTSLVFPIVASSCLLSALIALWIRR